MESNSKHILSEGVGIRKILEGMGLVATAVASTYGPDGKNVIFEDIDGNPHVTKDGVTVANSINLKDPAKNLGVALLKDAAKKTLKEVGDGTTTTIILANLASQIGIKATKGLNPFKVRDYLDKYLQQVINYLRNISTPINPDNREVIEKVALNSANGDEEISHKVAELFSEIGKDGIVFVKDSDILGIHTQIVKGISIDKGYISPLFCKNKQASINFKNCKILIAKKIIRDYKEIIPYLREASENGQPILLIVPEVDNIVTQLFLTNIYEGVFEGCIIQAPYSHERQEEFFRDLGIASGAIIDDKDVNSSYLFGEAEEIIISRYTTEFKGLCSNKEYYEKHKAFLEDLIKNQTDGFLAEKISERLAMFSGNIGYIYVGASSETEQLEIKDKLDDVIHAVKAALKEGTVPAGGIALAKAAQSLESRRSLGENYLSNTGDPEEEVAYNLMIELCKAPKTILGKLQTNSQDPTKVVYTALKNALSVAGLLFTSNYVVVNDSFYDYHSHSGELGILQS